MKQKFLPPPDGGLKPPKMRFADTFSAETVVLATFFPRLIKESDRPLPNSVAVIT